MISKFGLLALLSSITFAILLSINIKNFLKKINIRVETFSLFAFVISSVIMFSIYLYMIIRLTPLMAEYGW